MLFSEILALFVFTIFWLFVYSHEIKFLISFFKHKKLPGGLLLKFIHAFAILGVICFFYSYFIEPYRLKVNYINLKSAKIKKSFTLVQISDLHCDTKIRNEAKLVKVINEINPDIIVFTGDALNTKKALGIFQKTTKALKAKSGKFAVRGNFDVFQWKDIKIFKDTGFIELDGKAANIINDGQCIVIAGLAAEGSIENLRFLEKVSKNCYTILLFHYPGINEALKGSPIDLYLTGHTH
ncbi:MAG: metallophosphoesterase, partial [Candidatus Omnitrophica bacterium]|nr:metallophosphoesterase [Candidatus Omnitrophota bacterium]